MDAQVKAKWVTALRSGKYNQGQGALKRVEDDGIICHCCLGVLLEVLGPAVVKKEELNEHTMLYRIIDVKDKSATQMPTEFARQVASFKPYDCGNLAEMNDSGKSFAEIADYIEENL